MQMKPKSNSIITHVVEGNVITFNVLGAGKFAVDMVKLSPENQARAAIHGVIQRVSDGGALSRNPVTGKPATPQEKLARMSAIGAHLESGSPDWSMRREGAGGDVLLFAALSAAYPAKSPQEIRDFLEGKTAKQKAALVMSDALREYVDKIRKAQVAGIDADGLLADL